MYVSCHYRTEPSCKKAKKSLERFFRKTANQLTNQLLPERSYGTWRLLSQVQNQERCVGSEVVAIVIFVDDVMSAGSADDGRKAIRNCRELEDLKKVTYGLKKTKYMVTKTGREEEELINEEVGLGVVTKTNKKNMEFISIKMQTAFSTSR